MTEEEIEKQAELITGMFSYRNGYKTLKDAFIDGAKYAANEQNMKEVNVKVEDDEILVKYKIEPNKMNEFYGMVTHDANNVCGNPLFDNLSDEKQKMYAEAMIEDGILCALDRVPNTAKVLVSPMRVEKYLDGEYEEYNTTYICRELWKNVGKFVGYEYKEGKD